MKKISACSLRGPVSTELRSDFDIRSEDLNYITLTLGTDHPLNKAFAWIVSKGRLEADVILRLISQYCEPVVLQRFFDVFKDVSSDKMKCLLNESGKNGRDSIFCAAYSFPLGAYLKGKTKKDITFFPFVELTGKQFKMIQLLMSKGASFFERTAKNDTESILSFERDTQGNTLFHGLMACLNLKVLEELLEGQLPDENYQMLTIRNDDGKSPLDLALQFEPWDGFQGIAQYFKLKNSGEERRSSHATLPLRHAINFSRRVPYDAFTDGTQTVLVCGVGCNPVSFQLAELMVRYPDADVSALDNVSKVCDMLKKMDEEYKEKVLNGYATAKLKHLGKLNATDVNLPNLSKCLRPLKAVFYEDVETADIGQTFDLVVATQVIHYPFLFYSFLQDIESNVLKVLWNMVEGGGRLQIDLPSLDVTNIDKNWCRILEKCRKFSDTTEGFIKRCHQPNLRQETDSYFSGFGQEIRTWLAPYLQGLIDVTFDVPTFSTITYDGVDVQMSTQGIPNVLVNFHKGSDRDGA